MRLRGLGPVPILGALGTSGSTVLSLGCCADLLGPVAAVTFAGGLLDWIPLAWQVPLLYVSLAVTLGGLALGWRRHGHGAPVLLLAAGATAILYPLHEALDVRVLQVLTWLGLGLLLAAAAVDAGLRGSRLAPSRGPASPTGGAPR